MATLAEDMVAVIVSAWMIGGGLLDAWAHLHITSELESFATPYHAVLYSGFLANTLWTVSLAYKRRAGDPGWWRRGYPAGYRVGAIGSAMFLVGGVADAIWHQLFGVEADLEAILSPTHFILNVAAILAVSSPLRSWFAEGIGVSRLRAVTGCVAVALGTCPAGFFLVYASAFASNFGDLAPVRTWDRHDPASQLFAIQGLTCYLVTTAILVVPMTLVYRRRPVPGAGTAIVGFVALFTLVMYEFPAAPTLGVVFAVLSAAVAELILYALDVRHGRIAPVRLPVSIGLFAGVLWSAQLAGLHLADGVRWPVELWTGTIVLTMLAGGVLGGLAERPIDRKYDPSVATVSTRDDQSNG